MRRRDFLKASAPVVALPVVCASESRAQRYPTELTIERVTESHCFLDPHGVAVRVQHRFTEGIRVFADGFWSEDRRKGGVTIREGLTTEEFAAAGYRYAEAVFYKPDGASRYMQSSMFRSDDEVVIVEHMDAETFYASSKL